MPDRDRGREQVPLAAAVAVSVVTLFSNQPGWLGTVLHVMFLVCGPVAFFVGLWARPVLGVPACLAMITTNEFVEGYANPFVIAIIGGAWLVAAILKSRQRIAAQLAQRARELDAEREVFAQESVRYERARIARELHDIVAHCVSVMVVQAAAGQRLVEAEPELAAQALGHIAQAAEQAQTEMGRLVELLDHAGDANNVAGLELVDELVARAQATGLDVSCRFAGRTDGLGDRVAETLYRVVQEAVTNALKHAPGSSIEIDITGSESEIDVSVVNGPAPQGVGVLHTLGGSNGLRGMRERVAGCGGMIDMGPTPEGGWAVRATLPRTAIDALARTS